MLMWRLYTIFIKVAITQVVSVVASAPAIAGTFAIEKTSYGWGGSVASGCFYNAGTASRGNNANHSGSAPLVGFSAANSSSIYGSSATVRPVSRQVMFILRY